MHAICDRMCVEQVPELRELMERAERPLAAQAARCCIEDLTTATQCRKCEQQSSLSIREVGALERCLNGDQVPARQRSEHTSFDIVSSPADSSNPGTKSV